MLAHKNEPVFGVRDADGADPLVTDPLVTDPLVPDVELGATEAVGATDGLTNAPPVVVVVDTGLVIT